MNDDMQNDIDLDETSEPEAGSPGDQLNKLKEKARVLGITFSNNIGIEALRKKINNKMDGLDDEETVEAKGTVQAAAVRKKTKAEIEQEIREQQNREQLALVRCRIYNLNPSKRDLHGEIITVANRFVGTVRRFIPFGEATENGYHIEKILYEELKQRRFQQIKTKTVNGRIHIETRDVPEYQIEVMPQLTRAELEELALAQQAAERVGV